MRPVEPKPGSLWRRIDPVVSAFVDMLEPAMTRVVPLRRWTVVELENDDFDFYRIKGSAAVLFGRGSTLTESQRRELSSSRFHDVELRLLADRVMTTTIKVPAVGVAHIEQIIAHRLDRLTPWAPETLLYGFSNAGKPGADGQIDVEFAATSQQIAAVSIGRLEAFGLTPFRLGTSAEPAAQRLRIDLFRGGNDTARSKLRRCMVTVAIAAPLLCLAAFLVSTYLAIQTAQHLADAEKTLLDTRQRLVNGVGSTADRQLDLSLIDAKTPESALFVLIDRLARSIPDHTFLDEINIEPTSLRMTGTSSEASTLIEILEAEPSLSNATFAAPVTRQEDGRDRFDVVATRVLSPGKAAP